MDLNIDSELLTNDNFLVNDLIIDKIKNIQIKNIQIRPNWYTNLEQFYKDFIKNNIFSIVILLILSIFLIFRYLKKKERKKKYIKKIIKPIIKSENIEDYNDDYLDEFADKILENKEYEIHDENTEENLPATDKIIKYYDDLEKSGLMSSPKLEQDRDNDIKKLNFDQVAKLFSGNN